VLESKLFFTKILYEPEASSDAWLIQYFVDYDILNMGVIRAYESLRSHVME